MHCKRPNIWSTPCVLWLKRIAVSGPVWYEPAVLAAYRVHSKSDTSALVRSGRNMEDMRRSIRLSLGYLPPEAARTISRLACLWATRYALRTALKLLRQQELSAAFVQTREVCKNLELLLSGFTHSPDLEGAPPRA